VFHGLVQVHYYVVIPESEDPWGRIPLALYRASWIEGDSWSWEELNQGRGNWLPLPSQPDPSPLPLREVTRAGAHEVVDTWKDVQMAPPWVDLEGRTGPAHPGPSHPTREPTSRSERWQWRIFGLAMLVTAVVIVLKNVG
jgi:hypothetical protein